MKFIITTGRPSITTHPKSQLVTSNMNINLYCEGVGEGTTKYQWKRSKVNESRWMTISNDNNNKYVVKNLQHSERFICIVSNKAGETESEIATLTLSKCTAQSIYAVLPCSRKHQQQKTLVDAAVYD